MEAMDALVTETAKVDACGEILPGEVPPEERPPVDLPGDQMMKSQFGVAPAQGAAAAAFPASHAGLPGVAQPPAGPRLRVEEIAGRPAEGIR